MQTTVCKLDELNLTELAEFTSIANTGNTDKTGMFAGWFEEDLLPLEHVVILGKETQQVVGWVLLVDQGHGKMEINPWLLGGHPIASPDKNGKVISASLLEEAVLWTQDRKAKCINLTIAMKSDETDQEHEGWYAALGFPLLLKYVEMRCNLSAHGVTDVSIPAGITLELLKGADENELYDCYLDAFQHGDAKFFFTQNADERRDYFGTLGLDDAREHVSSSVLRKDGRLIGFAYVLPYGEGNGHISCMCVAQNAQGLGLGRVMLHHAMHTARKNGLQSMTLGTETEMRAFKLYEKSGFEILGGAMIFERNLKS